MSELLIPDGGLLLHIGPQKTGTTAIQVALASARKSLGNHGAYYPKGAYRRRKAGWAIGLPGGPSNTPIEHWTRLVDEVRAQQSLRVCVSDEGFARAEPAQVERIVSDFGRDRIHIIAVARRLDRFLPSQWQERVKSGVLSSYEEWLREILGDAPTRERWNVWQGHDTAGLIERWGGAVDASQISVLAADESDRNQLPTVFEQLLGLPAGTLIPDPNRSNESLTWPELELLREVGRAYREAGGAAAESRRARLAMIKSMRNRPGARPGPRTPPLPAWAHAQIQELSAQRVAALSASPVRVIGDLAKLLVPDADPQSGSEVSEVSLPMDMVSLVVEGVRGVPAQPVAPRPSAAAEAATQSPVTAQSAPSVAKRVLRRLKPR